MRWNQFVNEKVAWLYDQNFEFSYFDIFNNYKVAKKV